MMSEEEVRKAHINWSAVLDTMHALPDQWTPREVARAQGYVDCLSMVMRGTS